MEDLFGCKVSSNRKNRTAERESLCSLKEVHWKAKQNVEQEKIYTN